MALQLLTPPNESLLGRAAAGLRLRLSGRSGQSQVIEIHEAKCTIGTAANCTVRLPETPSCRRLDPIQCFVFRGDAQTVVRRVSPGIRLNGREFTDAVLQIGDRLTAGAYEIEVLPPGEGAADAPRDAERLDRVLAAERTAWQSERNTLRAELDGARAEIERLVADAPRHVDRHHQLQNAVAELEVELGRTWKALEEDRGRWQVERQQQHQELSQKTTALTAAVRQASRLESALAQANDRAAQHAADANAMAAQYKESQAALARLQSTLDQQGARFAADRGAWHDERELRLAESRQMSLAVAEAIEASSHLQDELNRVSKRAAQLRGDSAQRAAQQAAAEQTIARLTSELADAQRHLNDTQAERAFLADQLSQRAIELADAGEKAIRLEAELSQATSRLAKLAEELDQKTALCQRTQAALETADSERAELLEAFEQDRRNWQAERAAQSTELGETAGKLADALGKAARLEVELSQVNERLEQLADELDLKTALCQQTQAALETAGSERAEALDAFERDRTHWRAELDARSAELSETAGKLADTLEKATHLEAELSQANERLEQLAEELDKKTALCQQTQAALETAGSERAEALEAFEQERSDRQAELDARSADLSETAGKLADALGKATHLEAELSQANERFERLAEELDQKTALCQRTQAALETAGSELGEIFEAFEQERTDRQAELGARSADLNETAGKLADALGKATHLEAELSQANERLEQLAEELDQKTALCQQTQAALDAAESERAEAVEALGHERTHRQAEHDVDSTELSQTATQLAAALDRASRFEAELSQANERLEQLAEELRIQTALGQSIQEALDVAESERSEAVKALAHERTNRQAEHDEDSTEQSQTATQLADALDRASSLEAELSQAHQRSEKLAEELSAQTALCQSVQEALDAAESERAEVVEALEQERADWQAQQNAQATELSQKSSDLTAAIDQLSHLSLAFAEANAQVQQLSAKFDQQNELPEVAENSEVLEQEPEYLSEQAESVDGNLPDERQITQTDDLLARFAEEEEEIAFEAPSSEAPVTTADLLSRFGLSVDDTESQTSSSELTAKPCDDAWQPTAAAQHEVAVVEAHRDEEESIDAYMAQLMARLGQPAYSPPSDETTPAREVAKAAPAPQPLAPAVERPAEPKLRDPSEMGRRALPPERSADLSAMREIANLNARTAIDTHFRRNLLEAWISKAAVMVLGLGAAGTETWFALEGNDTASYFIVPSMMVAMFWGWQYLAMSKRLSQSRAEEAAEEPAAADAGESEATVE